MLESQLLLRCLLAKSFDTLPLALTTCSLDLSRFEMYRSGQYLISKVKNVLTSEQTKVKFSGLLS